MDYLTGEGYMISDAEFGELRGQVKTISEIMEKFDRRLFGNGQKGLNDLVKENASQIAELREEVSKLTKNIHETNENVKATNDIVQETVRNLRAHMDDPRRTFKSVVTDNWKSILLFVVSVALLIHAIVPNDWTIWDLFEKLFF